MKNSELEQFFDTIHKSIKKISDLSLPRVSRQSTYCTLERRSLVVSTTKKSIMHVSKIKIVLKFLPRIPYTCMYVGALDQNSLLDDRS